MHSKFLSNRLRTLTFCPFKGGHFEESYSSCSCQQHHAEASKESGRKAAQAKDTLPIKHQKKVSGNSEEMFQRVVRDELEKIAHYLCLTFCTTQVIL